MSIRSTDRRGYAQAMFLVVLTLLTSLTMLVLTAVNADLKSSHDDVALAQARALAETGLEEFDSQLLQNTDTTLNKLLQNADGTLLANTANATTNPALATLPTYHRWMTYQPATGGGATNRSGGATTGTAQACQIAGKDDYTRDCFYVDLDRAPKTTTVAGHTTTSDPLVTINVIARTRCGGSATGCTYAALEQRLRNRQLFDYLFYTQFDALDPALYPITATADGMLSQTQAAAACGNRYATRALSAANGDGPEIAATGGVTAPRDNRCLEVSYQADPSRQTGDVIRGPVFTNDDRIVVCGTPQFTDAVTVAGDGTPDPATASGRTFWASAQDVQATAGDTGCGNSQPLNGDGTAPAAGSACLGTCTLRLPPSNLSAPAFQAATAPAYQVSPITGTTVNVTINAPSAGAATSTLTFGNAKDASGTPITTPQPLPPNFLLYVNGDALLGGNAGAPSVLAGKLNIFAAGTLTVDGDVRYCARPSSTTPCDASSSGPITDAAFTTRLSTLNTDSSDLLVLMGGSIQLTQPPTMTTHRELDGLLVALTNAVSVQNWRTPQSWAGDPAADPVLHFFGAMAGKYQGVFGSYNAALGSITSGYHKDFYFDSRLRDNAIALPYYPLSPGQPNWIRVDTADVPGKLSCRQAQAPGCP